MLNVGYLKIPSVHGIHFRIKYFQIHLSILNKEQNLLFLNNIFCLQTISNVEITVIFNRYLLFSIYLET